MFASPYVSAYGILCGNFIPPEKITEITGLQYTKKQVAEMHDTLPSSMVLKELQAANTILIAGPPQPLNFSAVFESFKAHFYSNSNPWFMEPGSGFTLVSPVRPGWMGFKMGIVDGSAGKTYERQCAMVADPYTVPSAAELAWAAIVYYLVREVDLLGDSYGRTSSWSCGLPVHIGRMQAFSGLLVNVDNDRPSHHVGIAAVRHLE